MCSPVAQLVRHRGPSALGPLSAAPRSLLPSLEQLGTAFVEGKLELEGDIGEAIRVCDELSEALLPDFEEA